MALKDAGNIADCVACYETAMQLYVENGNMASAAEVLARGAKICETVDPEKAVSLFKTALKLFKTDEKDTYSYPTFKSAVACCLRHDRVEDGIHFLRKQLEASQRLQRAGDCDKCCLSAVVLRLYQRDYVAADRAFDEYVQTNPTFVRTGVGAAAMNLLDAYEKESQEMIDKVVRTQEFTFLDNEVAKYALRIQLGCESLESAIVEAAPVILSPAPARVALPKSPAMPKSPPKDRKETEKSPSGTVTADRYAQERVSLFSNDPVTSPKPRRAAATPSSRPERQGASPQPQPAQPPHPQPQPQPAQPPHPQPQPQPKEPKAKEDVTAGLSAEEVAQFERQKQALFAPVPKAKAKAKSKVKPAVGVPSKKDVHKEEETRLVSEMGHELVPEGKEKAPVEPETVVPETVVPEMVEELKEEPKPAAEVQEEKRAGEALDEDEIAKLMEEDEEDDS
eukprot:TRINITY_DN1452_c0_g1_i3.p1 TRINITY_DN1452_c0_g1~~TRINITY_DN1452_c0_g1_i3.p1  ORF type:complete len:451 (+),score=137.80 TRINITY_DN1452_c0_g1_i3:284-1636(+)